MEGRKPKLDDLHFLDLIQEYDILLLTETWKADTSKISIEGSWDYSQIRLKDKNAIRHWVGIIILAKHNIRPGIKLAENSEGFTGLN